MHSLCNLDPHLVLVTDWIIYLICRVDLILYFYVCLLVLSYHVRRERVLALVAPSSYCSRCHKAFVIMEGSYADIHSTSWKHSNFFQTNTQSIYFFYSASLFCLCKAGRLKSPHKRYSAGFSFFLFDFGKEVSGGRGGIQSPSTPFEVSFPLRLIPAFLKSLVADLGVWLQGNFDLQSFQHFEL